MKLAISSRAAHSGAAVSFVHWHVQDINKRPCRRSGVRKARRQFDKYERLSASCAALIHGGSSC